MFRRFSSLPSLRWILLGALFLRAGAAIGVQRWVERPPGRLCLIAGDAEGYWELARHIARGESFALYDPPRFVMRMPGFPLFLAGIMKLFGERILLTRILLAIVGTGACWLVYWLGRELADEATGRIAALLAALSPTMTVFSVLLLSETLFALTLLASLVTFARLIRAKAPRQALCAALLVGLSCGLATLVRPTWFLIAPAFALIAILRPVPRRQKLVDAALIVVAFSAVMAPWTIRNARVTGHFVPTTLWVGPSLYDGLSPQATGASDMRFIEKDGIYRNPGISEYGADQQYRRAAWEFVRAHPSRAAELTLIKLGRFWNPFPNADQFAHWAIRLGVGLYELPVLLLAVIGSWVARKDSLKLLLAAGPVLYFALVHALFVGSMRYRLPAEYALLVLSALAIGNLFPFSPLPPGEGGSGAVKL
jgi:4-amino-4-deoxy-L-arabinose transferase-like glycosyltransferase